jgi:hypothetical protein
MVCLTQQQVVIWGGMTMVGRGRRGVACHLAQDGVGWA